MTTETLLLLVLLVVLVGIFPVWSHSKPWGYGPTGALTLVLVIFLIWALAADRPLFRSSRNSIRDAGHDLKAAGRDVADSIRQVAQ